MSIMEPFDKPALKVSDPSQPKKIFLMKLFATGMLVFGLITLVWGWAVLDELEDIKAYLSVIAVQEI